MTKPKKLIEVALPLEAINAASAKEKSLRHGHPSTLHLWWARRPLATARAVLFASLVDDPSAHPERFPDEASQQRERERLFTLLSELVQWDNLNNQQLWEAARAEILASTGGTPPPLFDPFAGGGSIPLEAQRLGLTAFAGDLNPVAVLINMALIEIPPRFAGQAPVHPQARAELLPSQWQGAHGLAADLRAYGNWLREEAQRRIGHLYPPARLPEEEDGQATVIAWLWARTVTCPNPACRARMPLVRTFWLSKRPGHEAWIEPQVELSPAGPLVRFVVRTGKGQPRAGTVSRQGAHCIACGNMCSLDYVRKEGLAGRLGSRCIAVVVEGKHRRVYLSCEQEPQVEQFDIWKPGTELPNAPRYVTPPLYGMTTFGDLFTPRQLAALTTFSALVQEAHARVEADARAAGLPADDLPLQAGGRGPRAYADAVATYLALAVDRCADYWSSLCSWHVTGEKMRNTFTRQALPMVWDFAEANPFSASSGNFQGALDWVAEVVEALPAGPAGQARQRDALSPFTGLSQPLISTDPPYYDNVGYADLSDFFYLWLRRMLAPLYPDLFSTLLTPKQHELIAAPHRFAGNKDQARRFFEEGLHQVFLRLRATAHPDYPLTIYYAFKQAELDSDETPDEPDESAAQAEPQPASSSPRRRSGSNGSGRHNGHAPLVASTGWETMLQSLIEAGFTITGTWPVRTELQNRPRGQASNALASSIVLVCRPRPEDAPIATRKEFLRELRSQLPQAVRHLQRGGISPVDLAQASIGPGMAIYSQYRRIEEADGRPLTVRTALQLINQTLDHVLAEQEGDYDSETRWALAWFEAFGFSCGPYGYAETLSKAKNISLARLQEAGLLQAAAGQVRLLTGQELASRDRDQARQGSPSKAHLAPPLPRERPLFVWEITLRLAHAILDGQGQREAAQLLSQTLHYGEAVRELAYRLYTLCERKGWARDALAYNSLIAAWTAISALALEYKQDRPTQGFLAMQDQSDSIAVQSTQEVE